MGYLYRGLVTIDLRASIETIENLCVESDNNGDRYKIVQQEGVDGESVWWREISVDDVGEKGARGETPRLGPVDETRA